MRCKAYVKSATTVLKNKQPTCTCTTLQVAAVSIGQLPDANSRLHDSSFADEPDNPVTDNKENEDVGVLISNTNCSHTLDPYLKAEFYHSAF